MTSTSINITPFMWFLMNKGLEFTSLPEIREIIIGPPEKETYVEKMQVIPRRIYFSPTDDGFEVKDTWMDSSIKISREHISKKLHDIKNAMT